jgi:hypothetical protein
MNSTLATKLLINLFYILVVTRVATRASAGNTHSGESQYHAQEKRQIKSLSESDINSLRNGKGWGLAKAAELNGIPGPSHLLQLKKEIQLRVEQEKQIQQLFDDMKQKAIHKGLMLIELEQKLETGFQTQDINKDSLLKILTKISKVRRDLRFIHLSTHLATPKILDKKQIVLYNKLRGYDKPAKPKSKDGKPGIGMHQHQH